MENIVKTSVTEQISQDFLEYAVSTLNRSLPSAIDGLKISQRRIIQCAYRNGFSPNKPFKKVAKLSGLVMGNMHPHSSVSPTISHMGRPDSFPHTLMELFGNGGGFSSNGQRISEDPPSADRYLECRLSQFAFDVYFSDGSHEFAPMGKNYDGTLDEITEFVPQLPMAIFNGGSGIACGYSTNLPYYNLRDFTRYLKAKLSDKSPKIPVFDFPQGCNIPKDDKLVQAMQGKGVLTSYGNAKVSKAEGKITITELPTGSAETFCEKLKKAYDDGKITSLGGVQDLSDQSGIHLEVFTKKRKKSEVNNLLNEVYQHTNLLDTISVNQVLLYGTSPRLTNFQEIIDNWLENRRSVLLNMFVSNRDDLKKEMGRSQVLYQCLKTEAKRKKFGLILTISPNVEKDLEKTFKLNTEQIQYVLSLPIRKITKLNEKELLEKISSLAERIDNLNKLIKNPSAIDEHILNQVEDLNKKYGKKRKTQYISPNDVIPYLKSKSKEKVKKEVIKTKADLWMEKAIAEGKELKKPITKRGINSLIKKYYAGELDCTSLEEAWTKEKNKRNGVKVSKKRRKKTSKNSKGFGLKLDWVKTREDVFNVCLQYQIPQLGKRAVTIALKKDNLCDRLEKHVKTELRKLKR